MIIKLQKCNNNWRFSLSFDEIISLGYEGWFDKDSRFDIMHHNKEELKNYINECIIKTKILNLL